MSQLFRRSQNARQAEKGQGLVEYALILVLVAVVVIAVLSIMGPSIGNIFSNVHSALRASVVEESVCVDFYSPTWHYVWQKNSSGNWVRIANPGTPLPICSWSAYGNNGSYPAGVR